MKSKNQSDVVGGRKNAGDKALGREKNPIVEAFARRLRQWRQEHNKTLRQVASDLGVSVAIVSEWENGHRFPAVKTLQTLVEYTGVPARVFVQSESVGKMNPPLAKAKPRKANG